MALRFPFRVKARTSTTGTSTYTIDESAPAAGWRSVSEAVLDGDLANGDQFPYIVVDSTVTGRVKLFELGIGTWNNTTKQLTRDVIYQPSAGVVSWGTGTRDFAIVDNPVLFLLLAGGTMSGALKVLLSGAILTPDPGTGVLVQRSATTVTPAYMAIVSGNASTAGLNLGDTDSDLSGGVWYDNANNALIFRTAATNRARITSTGVLQTNGGVPYENFASGTKWPYYQQSAPAGWTKDTSSNDRALRVVSGTSGGTNGGTTALSAATTGGTSIGLDNLPALGYTVTGVSGAKISGSGTVDVTFVSGSGTAHSHALALAYSDVIICSKN